MERGHLHLECQNGCQYYQPKIDKNSVVFSKEEYESLKVDSLTKNRLTFIDRIKLVDKARKETAEKILYDLQQVLSNKGTTKAELDYFLKSWAKQFGVEV